MTVKSCGVLEQLAWWWNVHVQQEIRAVAESLMADGEHYNIYNTVKKKGKEILNLSPNTTPLKDIWWYFIFLINITRTMKRPKQAASV